ncbi:MAG: alpha/beta family hydrolase [Bradymonadia bacterium]
MSLIYDGPPAGPDVWTVILAHGAGAPMDTPFMQFMAEGLAAGGVRVVRFEFPYMAQRRVDGKKRPPNGFSKLVKHFESVIDEVVGDGPRDRLVLAGKSMGSRVAQHIADIGWDCAGVMALGFPFHAPGKPPGDRIVGLQRGSGPPIFICQGTRDPFGKPEEIAGYGLAERVKIAWITDGDHSLVPRKSSGRTGAQNWRETVEQMLGFIKGLPPGE